jgi:hypothetical protein
MTCCAPQELGRVLEMDFRALFEQRCKSFGVFVFSDFRTEFNGLHLQTLTDNR